MPTRSWSLSKWKPVINLRVRSHMAFAMHLMDMMEVHFGGRVDLQKDILFVLHLQDRITNGAAHQMVEHLAEKGYLKIGRWGPGNRYKRITLAARPGGALALRIQGTRQDFPFWARDYFPGPPNHRKHLARHRALIGKRPPRGSLPP